MVPPVAHERGQAAAAVHRTAVLRSARVDSSAGAQRNDRCADFSTPVQAATEAMHAFSCTSERRLRRPLRLHAHALWLRPPAAATAARGSPVPPLRGSWPPRAALGARTREQPMSGRPHPLRSAGAPDHPLGPPARVSQGNQDRDCAASADPPQRPQGECRHWGKPRPGALAGLPRADGAAHAAARRRQH